MHRVILPFAVELTLLFLTVEATYNGDVRLRDGTSYSGRVEIYYNGVWGTVCDDYWDLDDANVVCRQLGFGLAVTAHDNAFYGEGTGPILLDDVKCFGYEERLDQCNNNGWYIDDCSHHEDAGVQCSLDSFMTTPSYWVDGSIRLLGGSSPNEGRVEVYWNGEWNTVCDDSWDLIDASVVCRQLGYSSAVDAVGSAHFGEGSGYILLDDVNCVGYESTLMQCSSNGFYQHNCRHSEDAGVVCVIGFGSFSTTPSYWVDGSVRLLGGSSSNEGRVEVYWNGEWNTVCDDSWDLIDASVVCRQLGYSSAVDATGSAQFGEGSGYILLDDVNCIGYESTLMQCSSNGIYQHNCGHSEDAGVVCATGFEPTVSYATVRLRGSITAYEGRVEIYYHNEWGTLCDEYFNYNDALVVCRQLGFSEVATFYTGAHFGRGSGPILRSMGCSGDENSWRDCNFSGWNTSSCTHSEDAGVACINRGLLPTTPYYGIAGSVRLQGGSSPIEGRVEVYWNGEWNTVCDDSWDLIDAGVVCRQLGYSSAVDAIGNAYFGEGSGDILLDNVNCIGYETSLMECENNGFYQHNCGHSEDAGVICADSAFEGYFKEGSVRLEGSSLINQGRVEIYHYGYWGTVCDDSWDLTDADVVCKQLGYPGAYAAYDLAYFGEGETNIMLDEVSCDGSEHYLADCNHNGWYNHNCAHSEDAGVRCYTPDQFYPRLVNGTNWYEGRVEVWNSDHWEGVCSYNFYEDEASTVCKQLGFGGVDTVYYWEKFGNDFDVPSSIYFDCDSYNTALSTCGQYHRSSTYCYATAIICQQDTHLSGGAIAGIVFAVLIFFGICTASCITVYRQAAQKNRRSSPTVAVISGFENFAGPQSTSPRFQPLRNELEPNMNGPAPPTYNDSVSNPMYYPPVNTGASMPPHFNGQSAMQSNIIGYPMQPNPAVPNANPSTFVYSPPTNTNASVSNPYPKKTYSFSKPTSNDLALPSTTTNSMNEGHATPEANKDQSQC